MYFDPADNALDPATAALYWLEVTGGLVVLFLFVSLVYLVLTRGAAGIAAYFHEIAGMAKDVFTLSLRRIWALTRLTFIEAMRRKALAVFVVFGLLFMFFGWFTGGSREISPDQLKVYVSFVLTSITWLSLPIVLILCCFGIPEDIRLRSIHTVVTKPPRRLEIVLGRVLGISMIGWLVLLVMSTVGYIWILRQTPAASQSLLACRVPVYGSISFLDRDGVPGKAGINVGDIWAFRSFIEGASKARARWTFRNVSASMLDAEGNLNLENSFTAFRSHKGDMTRQLYYDIKLFNPETNLSHTTAPQTVNENRSKKDKIPRMLTADGDNEKHDLLKDFLTKDGSLNVEISCLDHGQYIGMARPDLFIRMPDRPFLVGYFKAVFGVGLTIILVAMVGVAASTIVKGPIATLLTFVLFIIAGKRSHDFMDQLVDGRFQGGGVLESVYRLVTHMGPTVPLPENPAFKFMQLFDLSLLRFLWLCKQVIPRMKYFNMNEFVANGFDVPMETSVLPCLMITAGYVIPCVMLGYFALRVRELESK